MITAPHRRYFVILLASCFIILAAACQPGTPVVPADATPQAAGAVLPTPTAIPTPHPGGIYIDASQVLGSISPYLYGSNIGPWIAVPADMLDAAAQAGVTVYRFPGGAWGDNNDVKTYHIDTFIGFLERMGGAEASISVRLKGGTPEQAAEMVRYANIEKGYNVRFWSIGNEPTLFAAELRNTGIPDYDTEQYNREWREFATAMKSVDPGILLIGPDVHQYGANPAIQPVDSSGRNWMVEFLKENGDLVDIVSFHRYPFPQNNRNATIEDLRRNTQEWDDNIRYLRSQIHELTGRDLPIALTEVNSHWSKAIGGEGTPDSLYNAIWWADVLGQMAREGVFMVNHWLITSSGGQGGWGLVGRGELRPSYYVYQLYKQFGDQLVYASSDDPLVSIYAAMRSDGALTAMLVNLADEEKLLPLRTKDGMPGTAQVWRLDAAHLADNQGEVDLSSGLLDLPGQSVNLLVLYDH